MENLQAGKINIEIKLCPTCYKFKRAERAKLNRNTINKTTVQFDNEVGKFARQNL